MESIDENNGWKLTSNKSIAKISKVEIRNGTAVHKQEVSVGTPEKVRESVKRNLPNSKVEVEAAHNIQTFERENIQAVNNGLIKTYEFAVIQQNNIGDGTTVAPLETYDNTSETTGDQWMQKTGLGNCEKGEENQPLSKEGFFLKNMWDKTIDVAKDWVSSHENRHTASETEEKEHRTALWIVQIAIAVLAVAGLIIGLVK